MEADTMNFKPKSLVFWSPSGLGRPIVREFEKMNPKPTFQASHFRSSMNPETNQTIKTLQPLTIFSSVQGGSMNRVKKP